MRLFESYMLSFLKDNATVYLSAYGYQTDSKCLISSDGSAVISAAFDPFLKAVQKKQMYIYIIGGVFAMQAKC